MPPHVPRKRLRTPSPVKDSRVTKPSKKSKTGANSAAHVPARKATLFDDLEAGVKIRSAEKTKSALQQMLGDDEDDDDSSSLSSLSEGEFEDVPLVKRQKTNASDEEPSEDEDIEFEDVPSHELKSDPVPSGDLELTLYQDDYIPAALNEAKKGPSKRQKQIRNSTHCIHVQFLLWHNAIRNSWLCDQEVQAIMISHLTPRLWEEVDRWRRGSGLEEPEEPTPKKRSDTTLKGKATGKANGKAKGKQPAAKAQPARDWGDAANRLEKGMPDMSHGDPLFRLMKSLSSWWKQRFQISAPGLRKIGYMEIRRLAKVRGGFQDDEHDPEKHGERIRSLEEFRKHAQDCTGSRDVGAQLFTALLRGLGLEARMVANIQTLGFGWSKAEDANEEKPLKPQETNDDDTSKPATAKQKKSSITKSTSARPVSRRTRKDDQDALKMELDDSDEFADPLSENSDDESVIDVTAEHRKPRPALKIYDKDLDFPHYWTEVLSPVTQKYLAVDPIVKSVIGTNRDLIESLEPRGGKAEKAKQIMAYAVGFSQDGTAKDVTVRYLRKQLYPGRTKGVRMPVEKIPVYNKHGKVKRFDHFDWFRSVMRGYSRGTQRHPVTEADGAEDDTDLTPAVVEKKEVEEGKETLQYYKSSKEYALERHLKREEALLPDAIPVKVFRNKGKGGKVEEENVYLRKEVVMVKSAETWHKQGRAPIPGEEPLKHAPYRVATTNRRRELAEMEARTGEKQLQPLYSIDQTDWIIPDPIQDGIIPKNAYGNIDMFAEHMCPEGAVHLPYRGIVRVCKRLEIDFAEAVVGFEFGHRMAVPVIQGVVVAEEHQARVLEELEKDEAERARKEDEKRRKAALNMWRKLLMGLRIANRMLQDYGDLDDIEVFGHERDSKAAFEAMREKDENLAGGFLPEGYEEEDIERDVKHTSGYFPVSHEDDGEDTLEVEDGTRESAELISKTEVVKQEPPEQEQADVAQIKVKAGRKITKPKAKEKPNLSNRRRERRTRVVDSDEDEDEEEDYEDEEVDDDFVP